MTKLRYVHWRDGKWHLGYLEDYPDYQTQGRTRKELEGNLRDIYKDILSGDIPQVRKVDELVVVS
jgi:hypothetical protein